MAYWIHQSFTKGGKNECRISSVQRILVGEALPQLLTSKSSSHLVSLALHLAGCIALLYSRCGFDLLATTADVDLLSMWQFSRTTGMRRRCAVKRPSSNWPKRSRPVMVDLNSNKHAAGLCIRTDQSGYYDCQQRVLPVPSAHSPGRQCLDRPTGRLDLPETLPTHR